MGCLFKGARRMLEEHGDIRPKMLVYKCSKACSLFSYLEDVAIRGWLDIASPAREVEDRVMGAPAPDLPLSSSSDFSKLVAFATPFRRLFLQLLCVLGAGYGTPKSEALYLDLKPEAINPKTLIHTWFRIARCRCDL